LIGLVLLNWFSKRRQYDGQVFLMYIGWYGFGRFFIEGLRTDSLYLGEIRVSQLVAGLCVLVSVILLMLFRYQSKIKGWKLAGFSKSQPLVIGVKEEVVSEILEKVKNKVKSGEVKTETDDVEVVEENEKTEETDKNE
jgi:phosphatidylglycerol:prolipoprotein diacylglycerol transferase